MEKVTRLAAVSICALLILAARPVVPFAQAPVLQPLSAADGTITVTWGDPLPDPADTPKVLVHLNTASGASYLLTFAPGVLEAAGGLTAIHMRDAHIEGLAAAGASGTSGYLVSSLRLFSSVAADPEPAVTGSQPWINVLCKFHDKPSEPNPPSFFQTMMSAGAPGLDHYWREVSSDLANIAGSQVTGAWLTLPSNRDVYIPAGQAANLNKLADDCANAGVAAGIYFPSYVGINLIFNDSLDCCAWGGGRTMTLNGVTKSYRTTWMPTWAHSRPVFAHEMGHGFGLPHSSGPYGNTYDSKWDPMSDASPSRTNPVCGCPVPVSTISYHKDILGWIPPARKYVASPNSTQTVSIERLDLPTSSGAYLMAQIQIGSNSNNFYTVEARRFSGYDVNVPGEAIVIHNVLSPRNSGPGTPGSPANVVDADGNGNPNDAGAMWLPGETFADPANGIAVRVQSVDATSFSVTIARGALMKVNTNAVTIGRQGGIRAIGVTGFVPWTASTSDPWIGVSPASGNGDGAVTITVGPSAAYRRGTVTIGGQTIAVTQPAVAGDLTGTGRANIALYRPSTGIWYVNAPSGSTGWGGQPGDIPVAADYNGDGTSEVAIFRPSTGAWHVSTSTEVVIWGRPGDIPVPGDYNGDGLADLAVYRPSNGTWYVRGQFATVFGMGGDIPVPGDYNGDGLTDVAVYRRSTGTLYVRNVLQTVWGVPGDVPVPADYDGNGTTDVAVFRPGTGVWYVKDGVSAYWGAAGDVPVPLDFSGDGRADFAVFRAAQGIFYIYDPVTGATQGVAWGVPGDVPVVPRPVPPVIPSGDTDGDGQTDMTVYRPSTGSWWTLQSSTGFSGFTNPALGGDPDDQPALADFDGDGRADNAVFRPSLGRWLLLQSLTGGATLVWGQQGDLAVPGDYRGAGQSQLAVFRPSTGLWYVHGGPTVAWGVAGDIPVPADYDGDGRTDVAIYRPSGSEAGTWYIRTSSSEFSSGIARSWGQAGDVPAPADYDRDGRTDFAVFRPSSGTWIVLLSASRYTSYMTQAWGTNGDIPVPGDYNGDGAIDLAVYRPSLGRWYVKDVVTRDWGVATDVPFPQRPQ